MAEFAEFSLYGGKVKGKFYPTSHRYFIHNKKLDAWESVTGVTTLIGVLDKSRQLITWATELYRDYLLNLIGAGTPLTEEFIYAGCTLHEERKQEAAAIGDEVHKWAEMYIKHAIDNEQAPEMPTRREAQIGVNAFLDWTAAKFISSERVLYSKKHGYIGKMDIEAMVNGKLCLIDIKTSNGIYSTYGLQTAAYVKADEEYHGRWIIRVAKETEDEYRARMDRKNQNRLRKGKEPISIKPYQVFEAKFLDSEGTEMERDFEGFLAAKSLYEWNRATDTFGK
jgi:hypothetical protein